MTDVVWLIILMQLLELALNCYWMAQGALAIVLVSVSGKMNAYHVTSDSDTPSENSKFCNTTTIAEDLQTMSKQRDLLDL